MLPQYVVKYLCPRKCQAWEMTEVNSYARRKLLCKIQHLKAVETGSSSSVLSCRRQPLATAVITHADNNSHNAPPYLSLFLTNPWSWFFARVWVMIITRQRLEINVTGQGLWLAVTVSKAVFTHVTWTVCWSQGVTFPQKVGRYQFLSTPPSIPFPSLPFRSKALNRARGSGKCCRLLKRGPRPPMHFCAISAHKIASCSA